jgi:hypothetical protein
MEPPTPATMKKMKENARKAAQKKAKKAAKKAPSPSSSADQSGPSPAAAPDSGAPPSYLSTLSASTTPTPPPPPPSSTSAPLPAALLAELGDDDKPGWEKSKDAAWAQAQKNVCIRWVREKREKVARAEEALAAGRGSNEEVEVSSFIHFNSDYA